MNEKTKEIYSKMSFYEKVQLKKQRAEIALIDKIRGEEPKIINSNYQANVVRASRTFLLRNVGYPVLCDVHGTKRKSQGNGNTEIYSQANLKNVDTYTKRGKENV